MALWLMCVGGSGTLCCTARCKSLWQRKAKLRCAIATLQCEYNFLRHNRESFVKRFES